MIWFNWILKKIPALTAIPLLDYQTWIYKIQQIFGFHALTTFIFFFLKIGVLQQQLDFILEAFLHLAALRDSMINNRR